MCGRFTQTLKRDDLVSIFPRAGSLTDDPRVYERFNVAPTDPVLSVISRDGEQRLGPLRWGLIPFWAKDVRIGAKMINARAETLTEKPAYRPLLAKGRCLILADGFYEWRLDPDGKKRPVRYTLDDGAPFGFAGLWTGRREPETGEDMRTCTIITTSANPLVAHVHDRMPVIIPRGAEEEWLARDVPVEAALSLLVPYPAEHMHAADASMLVNSVENDDLRLFDPSE
jgi:putative SOS response-associated peptidase YedK